MGWEHCWNANPNLGPPIFGRAPTYRPRGLHLTQFSIWRWASLALPRWKERERDYMDEGNDVVNSFYLGTLREKQKTFEQVSWRVLDSLQSHCILICNDSPHVTTVNQHPHRYLHLFERGILVTVLSWINIRFELRDPDLVSVCVIFVIFRNNLNGFWDFTMVPTWVLSVGSSNSIYPQLNG
jgi:hypothetical protein